MISRRLEQDFPDHYPSHYPSLKPQLRNKLKQRIERQEAKILTISTVPIEPTLENR